MSYYLAEVLTLAVLLLLTSFFSTLDAGLGSEFAPVLFLMPFLSAPVRDLLEAVLVGLVGGLTSLVGGVELLVPSGLLLFGADAFLSSCLESFPFSPFLGPA